MEIQSQVSTVIASIQDIKYLIESVQSSVKNQEMSQSKERLDDMLEEGLRLDLNATGKVQELVSIAKEYKSDKDPSNISQEEQEAE